MNKETKRKVISLLIGSALVAVLKALVLEKYFFEIKNFTIGNKESNKKVKLLLLTDLHFKNRLDLSYHKLANTINAIDPDLILIAGDIVDEDGKYMPARRFFSMLHPSIPKVGILGNHDHKSRVSIATFKKLFEKNNGTLLMNESKEFRLAGTKFMISGVDDFIEGIPSFEEAVKNVGREKNHLLLIHSPLQQEGIIREIEQLNGVRREDDQLNIQYIFAGHNHGGQCNIFGFTPIRPKHAGNYLKGWYNIQSPFLYLSRGFGTSTLPFRFGSRSEVTVFHYGV